MKQDIDVDYLFIAGCARSGTTAMARLLNRADRRILIGIERYKYIAGDIRPLHFYKEKFLNPIARETNILREDLFQQFREKWEAGRLRFVGDKVPAYYRLMPRLVQTFPYCKIIFMLRDLPPVASSFNVRATIDTSPTWPRENDYRKAVEEWNAGLKCLKQFIEAGYAKQLFIIKYERFFSGETACLNSLYDFLELPVRPHIQRVFENFTREWEDRSSKALTLDTTMEAYLEKQKNHALESWALQYLSSEVKPDSTC